MPVFQKYQTITNQLRSDFSISGKAPGNFQLSVENLTTVRNFGHFFSHTKAFEQLTSKTEKTKRLVIFVGKKRK